MGKVEMETGKPNEHGKRPCFLSRYDSITDVMTDHKLASLGDSFVNLIFSLYLSRRRGEPTGGRVNSWILAQAVRKAGLRELLPSRLNRHEQADAAEALIVYAWLRGSISMDEAVSILESEERPEEAFTKILKVIRGRVRLYPSPSRLSSTPSTPT